MGALDRKDASLGDLRHPDVGVINPYKRQRKLFEKVTAAFERNTISVWDALAKCS